MTVLTLSSDKTDFTTNLIPAIRLDQNKEYQAAFLSLHTYNSIPNVTQENNKFKYSPDKGITWKVITLPVGAYELVEVNNEIQRQMIVNNDYDAVNSKSYVDVSFYKPSFKAILEISNEDYIVDFGVENSIATTLGFTVEKLSSGIYESKNVIDIEKVNSILVHCDFILGSYVNSFKSNVIYSFSPRVSPGYKIVERPTPELIFYPVVNRAEIYTVRIWLTDQNNKIIDLMGEKITINIQITEKRS